jgi:hypothetical protein
MFEEFIVGNYFFFIRRFNAMQSWTEGENYSKVVFSILGGGREGGGGEGTTNKGLFP